MKARTKAWCEENGLVFYAELDLYELDNGERTYDVTDLKVYSKFDVQCEVNLECWLDLDQVTTIEERLIAKALREQ